MISHPHPPNLDSRPRAVGELLGEGLPRWLLYGRDREHPIHGVVMRGGTGDLHDRRVRALRVKLRRGQFLSRRSAAALHGLPLGRPQPLERVEVGAIRPGRPPRRPEVLGHQLRGDALAMLPTAPLWLPGVEDTWCLLAQVATKVELLAAADHIVSGPSRYEEPLSSLDELNAAAERFQGCLGATLRAQVLPLVRTGVESPAESELRLLIVAAGLPEPVVCCPVPCANRTLHADLGYPGLKIAIEYEGAYHFGESAVEQARRDVARVRAMEAAGWKVLRVTVHDLRRPREFLAELRALMLARMRGV